MSQLDLSSIHFICALHQKWNVRAHVCGENGPVFGKRASEMWSRLMQWAEGPEGFKDGYLKLKQSFSGDARRLEYLEELYNDDDKALFKKEFHFSNGVVVDVCESLISAVKTWVHGKSSRRGVSLLLTVIRIVQGTRELVLRSFLKPVSILKKKTVNICHNFVVKNLFHFWIGKLTDWAVREMYKNQDLAGRKYHVYVDPDHEDCTTVVNRRSNDLFVVNNEFKCFSGGVKRCFKQQYPGLHCVHSILVVIEQLTSCTDADERTLICERSLQVFNKNWFRSTYSAHRQPFDIPEPPPITVLTHQTGRDDVRGEYTRRFKEVGTHDVPTNMSACR